MEALVSLTLRRATTQHTAHSRQHTARRKRKRKHE
nr:MAG TPA: hypothetical protein [Caudoviricetes sp.]